MASPISEEIEACIKVALDEDIGSGDATTNAVIPLDTFLRGEIVAKQSGVIAGLDVAAAVFRLLDKRIEFLSRVDEGELVEPLTVLAEVNGPARPLLTGERTALNFLNRMSGIATLTHKFVTAISHTRAKILDTRKTVPGLRALDKLAVKRGGGQNHRAGLFDMILIKDNHIDVSGSLTEAVSRVRASGTTLPVEVEVRDLRDLQEALELGVSRILVDNFPVERIKEAVRLNSGRAQLEASGNVTLQNVVQIAETGVDFISVGELTHSAPSFDSSLKWVG